MPRLTKRIVDDAHLRDKPYFIWCAELPGFGVRVFPSGKRVYYADYRADNRRRRMTIGPHGKITTEEARKLAIKAMGSVIHGDDPLLERKTRRRSLTVAQLCDQYLEAADKGLVIGKGGRPKKASTLLTDRSRVLRHIKPLLGTRLVIDLQRSDVTKFLRDVTAGKTALVEKTGKKRGKAIVEGGAGTASRTVGLLGGILSYAVSEGIIEHNPAHGVKRPADRPRTRRLSPDEYAALGRVLDAADDECWQAVASIRLLALTGCRRGEITACRLAEVDVAGQALRLDDTKTGASVRPLGRAAIEAIGALPPNEDSPWLLPSPQADEMPYGGLSNAMERIARRAQLEHVTPHTLRHSFASVAGDLGYAESTIAALLGHAGTSVTSRYVHRLDSVLIAAADAISAEISKQMAGK